MLYYEVLHATQTPVNNNDELGIVVGILLILCGLLGILFIIDEGFYVEYISLTLIGLILGSCIIKFNPIWDEKVYTVTYTCIKSDEENANLIINEPSDYKIDKEEHSKIYKITTKDSYTKEELEDNKLLKKFE